MGLCTSGEVPVEASRGPQILWSCSYRWLCAACSGYWDPNSGLLEEQQGLLTTELSFSPRYFFFSFSDSVSSEKDSCESVFNSLINLNTYCLYNTEPSAPGNTAPCSHRSCKTEVDENYENAG